MDPGRRDFHACWYPYDVHGNVDQADSKEQGKLQYSSAASGGHDQADSIGDNLEKELRLDRPQCCNVEVESKTRHVSTHPVVSEVSLITLPSLDISSEE